MRDFIYQPIRKEQYECSQFHHFLLNPPTIRDSVISVGIFISLKGTFIQISETFNPSLKPPTRIYQLMIVPLYWLYEPFLVSFNI